MPTPVSATENLRHLAGQPAADIDPPPSGVNFKALERRFKRTCFTFLSSPWTISTRSLVRRLAGCLSGGSRAERPGQGSPGAERHSSMGDSAAGHSPSITRYFRPTSYPSVSRDHLLVHRAASTVWPSLNRNGSGELARLATERSRLLMAQALLDEKSHAPAQRNPGTEVSPIRVGAGHGHMGVQQKAL